MNTLPAASAARASGCDVLVIGGLYFVSSLLDFRRALKAWRVRKHNIRVVDETGAAIN